MTNLRQNVLDTLALVGKAMGNGHRLALLERLAQGETCVDNLAQCTGLTIGNTSQHLQHLRKAGLVTARRESRQIFYQLTDQRIPQLINLMRLIAETNLAEMERLVGQLFQGEGANQPLESIDRDTLLTSLEQGNITLLDVRPASEYQLGHLPGAMNIPMDNLEQMLDKLPLNQEIAAYCRGPYCVLSHEAAQLLSHHGYQVRRYDEGYPEWKAAGLPTD